MCPQSECCGFESIEAFTSFIALVPVLLVAVAAAAICYLLLLFAAAAAAAVINCLLLHEALLDASPAQNFNFYFWSFCGSLDHGAAAAPTGLNALFLLNSAAT